MDDGPLAAPSPNGHGPAPSDQGLTDLEQVMAVQGLPSAPTTNGHNPPGNLFIPVAEQIENVRRWNEELEWGIDEWELDALDPAPRPHVGRLIVDVVVPYLSDLYLGEGMEALDGVRHTCHELWLAAAHQQANSWSWDRYWDLHVNRPKPVRLLEGIVHRPGVRRVTLNLGAHWVPGRYIRPGQVRGPDSAHAEVLAAAAHFPRWIRAMDGKFVPYTWISGYQVTTPEHSVDLRLPALSWTNYRQCMSLTVDWADRAHTGFASPVCTR